MTQAHTQAWVHNNHRLSWKWQALTPIMEPRAESLSEKASGQENKGVGILIKPLNAGYKQRQWPHYNYIQSYEMFVPVQTAPESQEPPSTRGPQWARTVAAHLLHTGALGWGGFLLCKDLRRKQRHRRRSEEEEQTVALNQCFPTWEAGPLWKARSLSRGVTKSCIDVNTLTLILRVYLHVPQWRNCTEGQYMFGKNNSVLIVVQWRCTKSCTKGRRSCRG